MPNAQLTNLRAILMGFESVAPPENGTVYIQATLSDGFLTFFNTTNEQSVSIRLAEAQDVQGPLLDLAQKEIGSNQQVPLDTVWDAITGAVEERQNQDLIKKYQHFSDAQIHVIWEALHSFSPGERPKIATETQKTFNEVCKIRDLRAKTARRQPKAIIRPSSSEAEQILSRQTQFSRR